MGFTEGTAGGRALRSWSPLAYILMGQTEPHLEKHPDTQRRKIQRGASEAPWGIQDENSASPG